MPAGHVLPDVLTSSLKIVFCGSAAGRVSALKGAYYAGPGNKFWPTLHAIGLTPRLLAPAEFPLAPSFGFGFTDMTKTASGADADLPSASDDPEAVRRKIARFKPRALAFVGKRPARVFFGHAVDYGVQAESIGATSIHVLPSPSGLARGAWDVRWWHALAESVQA
ncbi:MAG: mismatch-specific DNA-glycosylase [Alphaproteobacteria bacterium]